MPTYYVGIGRTVAQWLVRFLGFVCSVALDIGKTIRYGRKVILTTCLLEDATIVIRLVQTTAFLQRPTTNAVHCSKKKFFQLIAKHYITDGDSRMAVV